MSTSPSSMNVSFDGIEAADLLIRLKGKLAISSGSACTSATLEPSHVMRALGLTEDRAASSVRIGLGRSTTDQEVNAAAAILVEEVGRLRVSARAGESERLKSLPTTKQLGAEAS